MHMNMLLLKITIFLGIEIIIGCIWPIFLICLPVQAQEAYFLQGYQYLNQTTRRLHYITRPMLKIFICKTLIPYLRKINLVCSRYLLPTFVSFYFLLGYFLRAAITDTIIQKSIRPIKVCITFLRNEDKCCRKNYKKKSCFTVIQLLT